MSKEQKSEFEDINGLGPATIEKLENAGICTKMSLAVVSPEELASVTGISESVARKIIKNARENLSLGFEQAKSFIEKRQTVNKIGTGCKSFDDMLGGGFDSGTITEVYGQTASGKTQLSHLMLVRALMVDKDSKAILIDSENTFRQERIKDFCEANELDFEDAMKRIYLARAYNSLPYGEQVILNTKNGLKKIKIGEITDISLETNSFNESGKINITKVNKHLKHKNNDKYFVKIYTKKGREITITPEHSLFIGKRFGKTGETVMRKKDNMKPIIAKANDIKIGEHIALPSVLKSNSKDVKKIDITKFNWKKYYSKSKNKFCNTLIEKDNKVFWYKTGKLKPKHINKIIDIDNDFIWSLGLLYAEGTTHNGITIGTEKKLIQKFKKIFENKFGIKGSYRNVSCGYSYKIYSRLLSKILKKMEIYIDQKNKQIPEWIINLPKHKLKYFIKGYWEGNGNHHSHVKSIEFYTTSREFIEDLNIILLRFGKFASIKKYKTSLNHPYYHLSLYGMKNLNIDDIEVSSQKLNMCKYGDLVFDLITKVERIPTNDEYVYDLAIDKNENFIGGYGCLCCHNSSHQMLLAEEIEKIVQKDNSYRLLVIDSLTSHFRAEYCLPKGTPITTINGDIDIENIKIGDSVLTHDGSYKKVLKTMNNTSSVFYKIKTTGINDLTITEEHPIFIKRNNEYLFVKPQELEENDYLCFPFSKNNNEIEDSVVKIKNIIDLKKFNENCIVDGEYIDINKTRYSMEQYDKVMKSKKILIKDIAKETGVKFSTVYAWKTTNQKPIYENSKVKRFIPMNNKLMRLIGYYISEGSINDHQIIFTFGENEFGFHNEVKKYMKELFDVDVNKEYVNNGACRLVFSRKLLTNFFKIFGTKSYNKHVPDFIINSLNPSLLLEIAKTEFNGDGYERKYEKMYNTTSSKLAVQLKTILAQNNIILGGKFDNRVTDIRKRRIYRLREYKTNSFIENGFIHYKYLYQQKIKTHPQTTYNLEVTGNNNYVANGVIVHNCGRGTLADRQQKLNKHLHQLLKIADLYNLVIIVTNQVQSDPGSFFGNPIKPIGGNIVSHSVTSIVYIRPGKAGCKHGELIDSPYLPNNSADFNITKNGFEDV
jgi:RecA/RadA recombinase